MGLNDRTQIGGTQEAFQTTHWTEILDARTLDEARKRDAVGTIVRQYWKPVYCYLRRKGCDNDRAKDLTQGFFHEIVLGRELISQADRKKGRFRTLLLTALDRYTTSAHRAETAKKRMPAEGLIPLDAMDMSRTPQPAKGSTPDQAFAYAWASTLLDKVLAEVKEGCRKAGQATHWEVFSLRILRPTMEDADSPALAQVCAQYGISDETKASNMVITVKRRFRRVLRNHVRQFVASDVEIYEEICELMRILSAGGAGL